MLCTRSALTRSDYGSLQSAHVPEAAAAQGIFDLLPSEEGKEGGREARGTLLPLRGVNLGSASRAQR
jgi:hypothetical protein